jgi:hypothetical protein
VLLAETKDHADWHVLSLLAESAQGEMKTALRTAVDEVESEEDEHVEWARETLSQMCLRAVNENKAPDPERWQTRITGPLPPIECSTRARTPMDCWRVRRCPCGSRRRFRDRSPAHAGRPCRAYPLGGVCDCSTRVETACDLKAERNRRTIRNTHSLSRRSVSAAPRSMIRPGRRRQANRGHQTLYA